MKEVLHTAHGILFPLAVLMFLTAIFFQDYTIAIWAVFGIYSLNILYACFDIREKILFFCLHLGIGLFWLTRPFFAFVDSERTWLFISSSTTEFVLWAIFLTLTTLFLGSAFSSLLVHNPREKDLSSLASQFALKRKLDVVPEKVKWSEQSKIRYLCHASLVVFLICLLGAFMLGYQKLKYMQGLQYEDYYLTSVSDNTSLWVRTLSTMAPYALCAYLVTMPRKVPATICLLLNVLTTIPMLIIGSRGFLVSAFLLLFMYYLLRNIMDGKNTWIGRKEKIILIIGLPLGIFVMGLWTYVRADSVVRPEGFFSQLIDAFYKQGVTFSVLGKAYEVTPQIQALGFKAFTIGSLIGYTNQGPIGTYLLGYESLGSGNSVTQALQGNSYSHTMSYFAHSNYLGGEGYGSSYVLELYTDFGFVGIIIFSFVFGMILDLLSRSIGKSWFGGTFALIALTSIFHMPRGSAIEWAAVIWTPQFWMAFILIIGVATVIKLWDKARISDRVFAREIQYLPPGWSNMGSKVSGEFLRLEGCKSGSHNSSSPFLMKNRFKLKIVRKGDHYV